MFYSQQPHEIRQFYINCWEKFKAKMPLTSLERQIVDVIVAHPEYHHLLDNKESINAQFLPELGQQNPFLHMGLHLAIREQVATDRPKGIKSLYDKMCKNQNPLEVEHQMFEVLAEFLWQSQRSQTPPDEKAYVMALEKLARNTK